MIKVFQCKAKELQKEIDKWAKDNSSAVVVHTSITTLPAQYSQEVIALVTYRINMLNS